MKIIPEGTEAEVETKPLEITDKKRTEMVAKAKELLIKPMETNELMDALEQYYVFDKNEHYTSAQLKDVAVQVYTDLNPIKDEPINDV